MKYVLILLIGTTLSLPAKAPLLISAHRGASGYEPENTLRSFERAIQLGAPMIELDVHVSKDGDLVVIHDFSTRDNKKVAELTTAQLKAYDVGKGEHIPLLAQVFDLVDQRAIINVELKARGTPALVAQLINSYVTQKKWDPKKFIISSFDHDMVRDFHRLLPSVPTAVIFEGNPIKRAEIATDAGAKNAVLYYQWVRPDFIADAHRRGVKVFVYTVNDKNKAVELERMGIDGIITNYPDLMSK